MRLTVNFRTLCLAGVAVVAVLAAGEALARGGGRSAGGHWIGGRGHNQHWGGGVHGGRVGFGGGRRAADFGGYGRRGLGRGGSYWGGYYGGGGVYYDDFGNYGDYGPDGPPAYRGGATIYAPNYYSGAGLPGSDRGLSAGSLPQLCASRVLRRRSAHHLSSRDAAWQSAQELQLPRGVRPDFGLKIAMPPPPAATIPPARRGTVSALAGCPRWSRQGVRRRASRRRFHGRHRRACHRV